MTKKCRASSKPTWVLCRPHLRTSKPPSQLNISHSLPLAIYSHNGVSSKAISRSIRLVSCHAPNQAFLPRPYLSLSLTLSLVLIQLRRTVTHPPGRAIVLQEPLRTQVSNRAYCNDAPEGAGEERELRKKKKKGSQRGMEGRRGEGGEYPRNAARTPTIQSKTKYETGLGTTKKDRLTGYMDG